MSNFKNRFSKIMKNILFMSTSLNLFLFNALPASAHFEGITKYGDPVEETKKAVTFLSTIIKSVGVVIFSWGLGELILAFKDDRPEDKTKAILKIVAGIVLISIEIILTQLGLWTG